MRAIVKWLHSPDIDIESYRPDQVDSFGFILQAMIGPDDGSDAAESFEIQVATPKWLLERYSDRGAVFGTHMLIVFSYSLEAIADVLTGYCQKCFGKDWQEVAMKVARIGAWEFANYQPFRPDSVDD